MAALQALVAFSSSSSSSSLALRPRLPASPRLRQCGRVHLLRSPVKRLHRILLASSSPKDSEYNVSVGTETKTQKLDSVSEEPEKKAEESKVSWNQSSDTIKEEVPKAEEVGQSAEKVIVGALQDTTEQLREQAEKAKAVLSATVQETAEKSKGNLTMMAENAPDPVKDIAETALEAHATENTKKGAKIHDFCLGIPYGSVLVSGGLLWFIISGSTAAIRFGVILGGLLLALSITSLKVWKQGKSSMPYIQGQAAITAIILIREIRKYMQIKTLFPTALAAIASAAMLGFYSYVYLSGGNPPKKVKKVAEA